MKRRQLKIIIFLFTLILLCSCSSDGQNNTQKDYTYIPKADEYKYNEEDTVLPMYEITNLHEFSSGVAWVGYTISSETGDTLSYTGCVNKKGKVLFSYPGGLWREASEFNNGVAYVRERESGIWYIINEDGDVLTNSVESDFEEILAYGDGYFLCYKDCSGFSSADNCYKIIDQTGQVIKEIIYEKDIYTHPDSDFMNQNPYYAGDGIFAFIRSGGYKQGRIVDFYNIKNGVEFSCNQISTNYTPSQCIYFNNGVTFIKRREAPKWILVYSDGSQEELNFEISDTLCYDTNVFDGNLILIDYDDNPAGRDRVLNVFYYSIADKTYHPLDQFIDNMYAELINNYKVVDNCFLVYLLGEDELPYIAVIGTNNEVIIPPIQSDLPSCVSCGRVVINTENGATVYDLDGNIVFTLIDIPRAAPSRGILSNYRIC